MSGKTSAAVVRFKDSRRLYYICHVNSIKDFYPKHSKDFKPDANYRVKWEKSFIEGEEMYSGWFDAEIIVLGMSEDEVRYKVRKLPYKVKITGVIPRALPESSEPSTPISRSSDGKNRKKPIERTSNHSGSSSSRNEVHSRSTSCNTVEQLPTYEELLSMYQKRPNKNSLHNVRDADLLGITGSDPFGMTRTDPLSDQIQSSPHENVSTGDDSDVSNRQNKDTEQNGNNDSNSIDMTRADPPSDQIQSSPHENVRTGNDSDVSNRQNKDTEQNGNNDSSNDLQKSLDSPHNADIAAEESDHLTDEEGVMNTVISDLKGEMKLPTEDGKVIIGKHCKLREEMWNLRVRPAKTVTLFVRSLAQGLWGTKRLRKRNLTGVSRSALQKKKATPRKKECVMAAAKGYLKYKNTPEAAIPFLLEKAQETLRKKMADTGKQNDPEYREKVKLWNEKARQRKKEKQVKKRIIFESDDSDE